MIVDDPRTAFYVYLILWRSHWPQCRSKQRGHLSVDIVSMYRPVYIRHVRDRVFIDVEILLRYQKTKTQFLKMHSVFTFFEKSTKVQKKHQNVQKLKTVGHWWDIDGTCPINVPLSLTFVFNFCHFGQFRRIAKNQKRNQIVNIVYWFEQNATASHVLWSRLRFRV